MRWSIEKRKRATTVLISCFLGLIATVTGAETPGDRWSAESIVSPWVEMWNAYDLDMVDKLFVIDDRVTYLSSEKEGTIVGIEAVREHHRGFG
ncbi:MAG: hypothetical protein GY906_13580, partial [bacterium]|nr:hypothetical protein [bacterium]